MSKKKTDKISQADVDAQSPDWKHPDDIAAEAEAKQFAKDTIDEWFASRVKGFKALVSTYPDGEAEEMLANLREEFWADRAAYDTWLTNKETKS